MIRNILTGLFYRTILNQRRRVGLDFIRQFSSVVTGQRFINVLWASFQKDLLIILENLTLNCLTVHLSMEGLY